MNFEKFIILKANNSLFSVRQFYVIVNSSRSFFHDTPVVKEQFKETQSKINTFFKETQLWLRN